MTIKTKNEQRFWANEFSRWGFCPLQWYLFKVTGRNPKYTKPMKQGNKYHTQKASDLKKIQTEQDILVKVLLGGLACLLLYALFFQLSW